MTDPSQTNQFNGLVPQGCAERATPFAGVGTVQSSGVRGTNLFWQGCDASVQTIANRGLSDPDNFSGIQWFGPIPNTHSAGPISPPDDTVY